MENKTKSKEKKEIKQEEKVVEAVTEKTVEKEIKNAEETEVKKDEKIVETKPEKVEEKKYEPKETKAEEASGDKKVGEIKTSVKKKLEDKLKKDKDEKKPVVKKKGSAKPVVKKDEAVALGRNLHVSKKQAVYICSFIKYKKIDTAIMELGEVVKLKKAVPFKGEIPHRKGKGMMSGRYPAKAAGFFITVLKGLKGNILVNGMDLDKTRISMASASWARRPMRSNGRQGKRTNVILKAKEIKIKK